MQPESRDFGSLRRPAELIKRQLQRLSATGSADGASRRRGLRWRFTLLISLAATALPQLSGPALVPPHRDPEVHPISESVPTTAVSLSPHVEPFNGSRAQHRRLREAVDKFVDLGLPLPDLEVHFARHTERCHGHMGLFQPQRTPWKITICDDARFLYEHELAHAWERANLDDRRRAEFMELQGYSAWTGADVSWNERGDEGVAFVIQQGMSDLPLPPNLGEEARGRLKAFELLTGRPAPQLVEWIASREVPCFDRPTQLGRLLADAAEDTCPSSPLIDPIVR